ncbi:F-box/LRR-repeat protein 20 [Ricinus communis]|uniref:F-box/LRR-repeat protein 20 n=1 Tax=Ricinus communis TaxID=3988 RepID=UPI00201B0E25|nr:F-box/LRR-repeat protein 20 [Ricinus communis]
MDNLLCDELLQEIFAKITKSSSSSQSSSSLSVSLVSKRWLHLYRTSKTSLSLRLNLDNSTIQSLSSLLANYPFLSSLSLIFSSDPAITTNSTTTTTTAFNDHLLFIVSTFCSKLKHLRFLTGPVSTSSLLSLSNSCTLLTSLTIFLSKPVFLNWIACFSCLKELSIYVSSIEGAEDGFRGSGLCLNEEADAELSLESLYLSGIKRDDSGFGWLWRSCKKLKKLQLKSCEGIGDGGSFLSFVTCLRGIQEVELRTCRSIIHGVLLRLAENCDSLNSLLIYDGGSREGLLHFISNCRCDLQKLDFRLPLDLNNDHLLAIAMNFRNLSILRLQSCCLVTGEGLKALGIAVSPVLQELALINCDVVERESGLLATLGQNLRQLKKLDLSHNEFLLDKEFISMLVSCNSLVELKLRGCKRVTGMAMLCMFRNCKRLECVDIMHCCGIEAEAIELFFLNSPRLRCVQVEESKLSDVARKWAEHNFIEVVA